jgi:hypothetical protein
LVLRAILSVVGKAKLSFFAVKDWLSDGIREPETIVLPVWIHLALLTGFPMVIRPPAE